MPQEEYKAKMPVMKMPDGDGMQIMVKETVVSFIKQGGARVHDHNVIAKLGLNPDGTPRNMESMPVALLLSFAKSMDICDVKMEPDGLPTEETVYNLANAMRTAGGDRYRLDSYWPSDRKGMLTGMAQEFLESISGVNPKGLVFRSENGQFCSVETPLQTITPQDLVGSDYRKQEQKLGMIERHRSPGAENHYKLVSAMPEYIASRKADGYLRFIKRNYALQTIRAAEAGRKSVLEAERAEEERQKARLNAEKKEADAEATHFTSIFGMGEDNGFKNLITSTVREYIQHDQNRLHDYNVAYKLKLEPSGRAGNEASGPAAFLVLFAKTMKICDVEMGPDGLPTEKCVDDLAAAMRTADGKPYHMESWPQGKNGKLSGIAQEFIEALSGQNKTGLAFQTRDGELCSSQSPLSRLTGKDILGAKYCEEEKKPGFIDRIRHPSCMKVYNTRINTPDYIESRKTDTALSTLKARFTIQQNSVITTDAAIAKQKAAASRMKMEGGFKELQGEEKKTSASRSLRAESKTREHQQPEHQQPERAPGSKGRER